MLRTGCLLAPKGLCEEGAPNRCPQGAASLCVGIRHRANDNTTESNTTGYRHSSDAVGSDGWTLPRSESAN